MLKLLRYYLPYKRNITFAVVCNLLMSFFMIVSIPVLQPFLQILFNSEPTTASPASKQLSGLQSFSRNFFQGLIDQYGREGALSLVCLLIVGVFFGKNLFRYLSMYFLAPVRNGIVRDLRSRLLDRTLALPLAYFSDERKGDLLSRFTSDVQEIEWSIVGVVEAVFREPLVIIGSLAFMLYTSPELTGFVFALMLFTAIIIGGIGRSLRRRSGEAQTRLGIVVSLIEETLGGLRIIQGFNAEGYQRERFERENTAYARAVTAILRQRDSASPVSEFLGISVVAVLLWYGSRQVFNGSLAAETFLTFLYAFYNVIDPAKAISTALYSIRKGRGALERVESLIQADSSLHDAPDAVSAQPLNERIEFNNVSFQYAGAERPALNEISFIIQRGKMTALVGASGAGKSTVADLLPRFYDVTGGQILYDGTDIRKIRLRDLREQFGIVSQEAVLFNDSVRNNIAFGKTGATQAQVEEAARIANAHEFITALPQGYNTNIGDRGVKLSGGQRQRLTIARALLKNPPVLILDEATSALDSESERLVQLALERLLANRTSLVIAHRLSTIQHADEILVLEAGKIVERGTHESLMQQGRVYKKLVELQAL